MQPTQYKHPLNNQTATCSKQRCNEKPCEKNHLDLQGLFHDCFLAEFATRLQGDACEPLYTPADNNQGLSTIFYREDYFSSALHEIAHWCIAGEQRRKQIDYGYWYVEDGRDAVEQANFESVEVKPQAIEWAFSIACDIPFSVSIDNLSADIHKDAVSLEQEKQAFTTAVYLQLKQYIANGFPKRAATYLHKLHAYYSFAPHTLEQTLEQALVQASVQAVKYANKPAGNIRENHTRKPYEKTI